MHGKNSYQPLVNVIIPNYNHAPYLRQRIDSVLDQTYQNFEVIILDDKSTDESREIMETYRSHPKVVHIEYNETNSGSTFKQWQKGLDLAKGEWIWIAESDDVADKKFLETLICRANKETGIVYCRSSLINEKNEPIQLYNFSSMPDPNVYSDFSGSFSMNGLEFIFKYMLQMNSLPNASAVIFKKQFVGDTILEQAIKTRLLGDWLFWISILKETHVGYEAEKLNSFRFHSRTVRNETHLTSTRLKEYMTLVSYIESNLKERKIALDTLLYHYLKGDVHWKNISTKDHISINTFVLKRDPLLLFKSYLRKIAGKP